MSTAPSGFQTPKTNWQPADVVQPSDLNRIEGNINAIEQGARTLNQAQAPSGNEGSLRQILSWLANRIRAITGMTNWYDAPPTTLTAAKSHIDAAAPHSGHATTAALTAHTSAAAPHSGHETPAGAQAKAEAAAGAVLAELNTHKAERATETKLGHVKAKTKEDGTLILPINLLNDNNVYNAVLTTDIDITKKMRESGNYGGNIWGIAVDDNYVYVGGATAQTVKKLNKTDLSLVATSASYGGTIYAIAVDDNYVYVGGGTTRTVKKLRKSDLSQVAESASYGGTIYAIAIDDNYVYVGGDTTKTVQKLNKTDLSQVATSASYGGTIRAIAVDDNHVYVGGDTTRTVKKLNKSDLSQVAESASYGGTGAAIHAIAIDDSYVYVGGWASSLAARKLRKSNLSQVADGANYGGEIYAIAVDDACVYVGGATARIVQRLGGIQIKELIRVV